ncbi:hypothetical protein [Cytobacillus firmus]|uniref:hypothetical protein n=1 Tax=Cytobacillus firmus TaxID=1399 RepID=UPI0018CDB2BF|nr:hypothetical protein [Cytobacillus firmus]
MQTVIKGRSMPEALYKKNGKYTRIRAVDVHPKMKESTTFYCIKCKVQVTHSQGKKSEQSKPYFRRFQNTPHLTNCKYASRKTLQEYEREVGTLENLHYGVKTPLLLQQQDKDEENTKGSNDEQKAPSSIEKHPSEIVINPKKRHKKHLLTVDDLFYELSDIEDHSDISLKSKLKDRIYGKIYYSYSQYIEIINNYKNGSLKDYFFVSGKMNINEFITLKDPLKSYAELYGKNTSIRLKIYPYTDKINKELRNLTYRTRENHKKYEFIGLLASLRKIITEGDKTIIELDIFEFDTDQYRYN